MSGSVNSYRSAKFARQYIPDVTMTKYDSFLKIKSLFNINVYQTQKDL